MVFGMNTSGELCDRGRYRSLPLLAGLAAWKAPRDRCGRRIDPMQRIVLVLPVCLLVLSGCALWEGPTLSDVCQVEAVGDVFGSTGTFDTAEAAVGSVVDDPSGYRRVGSDAGRVLYGESGDPPTQVVELERDENGWSVFAVNMCR